MKKTIIKFQSVPEARKFVEWARGIGVEREDRSPFVTLYYDDDTDPWAELRHFSVHLGRIVSVEAVTPPEDYNPREEALAGLFEE